MEWRDVARFKQVLSEAECKEILSAARRGVLSLTGDGGYPYGVPLNHFWCEEDGRLYFHSGQRGHKVDSIRADGRACYTVMDGGVKDADGWWDIVHSVIVFGRIEFIEDRERVYDIARRLSLQFTDDEDYIAGEIEKSGPATLMFALVPEHMTGKFITEK